MEDERIKASPAIKRIAKQYGIDLSEIAGTGEDGRIEVSDLEEYLLGRKRTVFEGIGVDEKTEDDPAEYAEYRDAEKNTSGSRLNYDDVDYITVEPEKDLGIDLYPEGSYDRFVDTNLDAPEKILDDEDDLDRYIELDADFARSFQNQDPDEEAPEDREQFEAMADDVADELRMDLMDDVVDEIGAEEEPSEPEDGSDDAVWTIETADEEDLHGHHHEHLHDHHDHEHHEHDHEEEEVCQPINISFRVPRKEADRLVYASGSDHPALMMDLVIKALALAVYDEDNEFDGRINLIRFTREGIEVSTAMDALSEKIGHIEYGDIENNEDVFVNVWDMTEFGFTSFSRPDAGMVNVFVGADDRDLIIDSISDEYTVCIDTCAFMFKSLRENLMLPAAMNERSETPFEEE